MRAVALATVLAAPLPQEPPEPLLPLPTFPPPQAQLVDGHNAAYWRWQYLRERARRLSTTRRSVQLRRVLLHQGSVTEALNLACTVYGSCSTLWRRARCESTLNPGARNASGASGLLQFLGSTWNTTPFARFSVFSPYANALAAGWMFTRGRGGEWSCR